MATWSLRDLDLSDLIGIVRYVQSEVRDARQTVTSTSSAVLREMEQERGGGRTGAPPCKEAGPGAGDAHGAGRNLREWHPRIQEQGGSGSEGRTWAQPQRIRWFAGGLWGTLRRPPLTQDNVRL